MRVQPSTPVHFSARTPSPRRDRHLGELGAVALLTLLTGCAEGDPFSRAFEVEHLRQTIGGPKALVREGDFILENDRIRLGILGTRISMGTHTSGASLADADLQRTDPDAQGGFGNDRMAETFPTVNLNIMQADEAAGEVVILKDGSDGGDAVICTSGPEVSFITLLNPLWALQWSGVRPIFHMRTDYTLSPGMGAVKIKTWAFIGAEAPCSIEDPDAEAGYKGAAAGIAEGDDIIATTLAAENGGLAFGDFYLQGGSVDVFTPDVGFDEELHIAGLGEQGVNTVTNPVFVDYIGGTADGVSYGQMSSTGPLGIPMFTSSQTVTIGGIVQGDGSKARFAPGDIYSYERWFAVGQGDMGSVVDALLEAQGKPTGRVQGFVVEESTGIAVPDVHVFAYKRGAEAPWTEWTTDVSRDDRREDGSFGGTLPPGDWELLVHGEGRPDGARLPITVKEGETLDLVLASPRPGSVHVEVVDETGLAVPAKVSFFVTEGESPRNSVLGDSYIGGKPAQVAFTADGSVDVVLPPGRRYYAVASRGVEYELGTSKAFEVTTAGKVELQLQVIRSVDTAGWVSGDFHVHGIRSQDSGVTRKDRVLTMAAEGVEFLSSNDHDALTDYKPFIHAMGLEPWVSSTIGTEVTTIELGHYLGFPLAMDHLADQGGALDWTGLTPIEIIEGLHDLGKAGEDDPFVFVAHPRDGILGYFDQYGFNPNASEAGDVKLEDSLTVQLSGNTLLDRSNFTTEFDGLEILNGKRFEIIRSPTQPELDAYAADLDTAITYDMVARTMAEQEDLSAGVYKLGYGHEGQVDDWFTLLNLGYRFTALGNSDTHGTTSIEAGCPRNFIMSETDDPATIDEDVLTQAVREHRVVASYGPFIRFYSETEDQGIGSQITRSGEVTFHVDIEAASWIAVDRVELYENGTLIREWTDLAEPQAVVRLSEDFTVTPTKDSWYVIVALGQGDLSPVFTAVDIQPIQLQDIVTDALAGVGLDSFLDPIVPIPRTFPVLPYAITNPIWVDSDGDGEFTPPGLPSWLQAPEPPAEAP